MSVSLTKIISVAAPTPNMPHQPDAGAAVPKELLNLRSAVQYQLGQAHAQIWTASTEQLMPLHNSLNVFTTSKTAALLDHLVKAASELDEFNTPDASQALEGLDAVLEDCTAGVASDAQILEKITSVATLLDNNYLHSAADILDKVVLAYEFKGTPLGETRKELYDSKAHNAENMWELVKHEVAENRKQDSVESHRPTTPTLRTRYSPDLPGVQCYPVAPGVQQDSVTKKIYDWNTGFTLDDGTKVPGGSVKHQTPTLQQYAPVSRMFDTRVELSKRKG